MVGDGRWLDSCTASPGTAPGTAELQLGILRPEMAGGEMADPGTAELQLGISSCRKTNASVAGVITFRMARAVHCAPQRESRENCDLVAM
jgi:hypothetical protein